MEFKYYTKTHELDPDISDSMWREIYFQGYRMFSTDHPQIKLKTPIKVKLHKYSINNNYTKKEKELFLNYNLDGGHCPKEGALFEWNESETGLYQVCNQELKCYSDLN